MYYTIYKVTNKLNNKFYVGAHATNDLDDGYMGSGKLIRRAIKKYGFENFEKEYVSIHQNAEEMFLTEEEIVNEAFVDSEETYNIRLGGHKNSWFLLNSDSEVQRKKAIKSNLRRKELRKNPEWKKRNSNNISKGVKKSWEEGRRRKTLPSWKGKKHKEESKRKIGEANKKHQIGEGNSQFGTCWIYSNKFKKSKKIDKNELEVYIKNGWIKGRKFKF